MIKKFNASSYQKTTMILIVLKNVNLANKHERSSVILIM